MSVYCPPGTAWAARIWIFDKVAHAPDIVSLAETQGNVMVGGPSKPFVKLIAIETARWRKLAQDNNIQPEE